MQRPPGASFRIYLPSIICLLVIGLGLAAVAVFLMTPTLWARWLLFFGATLGLTGLALPATWFLNLRFPADPPAGPYVPVRQALWVGIYAAVLLWLQQARFVTPWTAVGLAAGLIAVEYLVGMRERSRLRQVLTEAAPDEGEQGEEKAPPVEE